MTLVLLLLFAALPFVLPSHLTISYAHFNCEERRRRGEILSSSRQKGDYSQISVTLEALLKVKKVPTVDALLDFFTRIFSQFVEIPKMK